MGIRQQKKPVQVKSWARIAQFQGDLSPSSAKALLKVQISTEVESRMRELLTKSKAGMLTEAEKDDMDGYEQMACMLDILHSKARRVI
ncbi:MAG: hypothetical protein QM703_08830 [Gemmatales bacterium]